MANLGNLAGLNLDATPTENPVFEIGQKVTDKTGGVWMYIQAGAALTAYLAYKVLSTCKVGSATAKDNTVDDNAASFTGGFYIAIPQQAFTSGYYGWVPLSSGSGTLEAKIATGISAGAKLYTSSTAGVLAATASGHYDLLGEVTTVDANASGSDAQATIRVPFPTLVAGIAAA